jgi:hypothetical protein
MPQSAIFCRFVLRGGVPTAIVIDARKSCQHEQAVLTEFEPALALLSQPCQGDRPCQYAEQACGDAVWRPACAEVGCSGAADRIL